MDTYEFVVKFCIICLKQIEKQEKETRDGQFKNAEEERVV